MLKIQTIQMNMLEENCYVVFDESKEAVVIDCGALQPVRPSEADRSDQCQPTETSPSLMYPHALRPLLRRCFHQRNIRSGT